MTESIYAIAYQVDEQKFFIDTGFGQGYEVLCDRIDDFNAHEVAAYRKYDLDEMGTMPDISRILPELGAGIVNQGHNLRNTATEKDWIRLEFSGEVPLEYLVGEHSFKKGSP